MFVKLSTFYVFLIAPNSCYYSVITVLLLFSKYYPNIIVNIYSTCFNIVIVVKGDINLMATYMQSCSAIN